MKKNIKKLLFCMTVYTAAINSAYKGGSFLSIRSQSQNAARHIAGWNQRTNVNDKEKQYNHISIIPQFSHSFNSHGIAKFFFGKDLVNNNEIKLSGSNIETRATTDWVADYFGLPTDFESTVSFSPVITNFIIDFNWKTNFGSICKNVYLEVKAPLCHTQWDMHLKETIIDRGQNGFRNGYMDQQTTVGQTLITIPRSNLPSSFKNAIKGGTTFGDMRKALKYGKIDGCQKRTRLSDMHINIGYKFADTQDYHLATHLHISFPTGNKPNGNFLFEPVVGNGGHFQLGVNMNGHEVIWNSDDEQRAFSFYFDINLNHMFSTKQKRSFDLKDKLNSRYMLIAELGTPVDNFLFYNTDPTSAIGTNTAGTASSVQYQSELFPLINKSTLDCNVDVKIQADMAIKFTYINNNLAYDFGYNLWARTKENISLSKKIEEKTYVLKGDAHMYGFAEVTDATNPAVTANQAVALAPSQSKATINSGRNRIPQAPLVAQTVTPFSALGNDITQNSGIDNQRFARSLAAGIANRKLESIPGLNENNAQTSTSTTPIYISSDNLDRTDTAAITHKVFAHVSYTCKDEESWIPFIGLGVEGEFNVSGSQERKLALSQWGVWSKLGVSFN